MNVFSYFSWLLFTILCDRIDIIEVDNNQIFVRSKTDSLIYSVSAFLPSENDEDTIENKEYFLISGLTKQDGRLATLIGELKGELVVFDVWVNRRCTLKFNEAIGFINKENEPRPVRGIHDSINEEKEVVKEGIKCVGLGCMGVVTYPLSVFEIKTPSDSWAEVDAKENELPYRLKRNKRYDLEKYGNHYLNDSLHVFIAEDSVKKNYFDSVFKWI